MYLTRLLPFFVVFLSLASSAVHAQRGQDTAALRATLEKVYGDWRSAMIRSDAKAWAASITRYRQTVIRNAIVSERKPFPDAVFAAQVVPPLIAGLKLLEVQAVGTTAHLLYFGKVDMGQDREMLREHLLKLKFGLDETGWKYDSSRITSLDRTPDIRRKLLAGEAPDFLDEPEFTPPGQLPPIPQLCRVPDHKGGYKLESIGYRTSVSMSGYDYDYVEDGFDQQVITGGLLNGKNEITLKITPIERAKEQKASIELRVYLLSNDSDKPKAEVLRWKAPEDGAPATITLPFNVKP